MKKVLREILSTSVYILTVLLITYLIIKYVGVRTEVIGPSMQPTLQSEDNLSVEKLSYRFGDPERFDVIVFPFQYAERTYYIKRIIGLPGETVQIDDEGTIWIKKAGSTEFEMLEESYGKEVIKNPGLASEPIYLGQNEYFVLGDNRNDSSDSRDPSVGNIYRKDIIGKAWLRFWPEFNLVK